MDLVLKRTQSGADGVFGRLLDSAGKTLFVTLEHAYPDDQSFAPKMPAGTYTCKRGPHRLASMTSDFETFEVLGIPGHTGILFHVGNYNKDSSGCILLGEEQIKSIIIKSKLAFAAFMKLQEGADSFTLTVQNT